MTNTGILDATEPTKIDTNAGVHVVLCCVISFPTTTFMFTLQILWTSKTVKKKQEY